MTNLVLLLSIAMQ